jgi:hypothetical protein
MTLPKSYSAVAEALDIPACTEDNCYWGARSEHTKGFIAEMRPHYRERRMTRVGLYRFLKLVAHIEDNLLSYPYYWERRYMRSQHAVRLARKIHVTIPASVIEEDRTRMRATLARVRPGDLSNADRKVYDRALKWSLR